MRRLWVVVVVVCGGCLGSDDLIDGTFLPDQWSELRDQLHVPDVDNCGLPDRTLVGDRCNAAAQLGQMLFFDPTLSLNGKVSCVTCHDPNAWFIDSRPQNNVSFGVKSWTKRNSPTVVNLGLKYVLTPHHDVFTDDGGASSPGGVLEIAITKPMASDRFCVASTILNTPAYRAIYDGLFGPPEMQTPDHIFENVGSTFDAYLWRLVSVNAPFDQWLAGDETAIGDDAKRGFAVFARRGMCLDCHRGPLLTDFEFHVTGVPQTGPAAIDPGRSGITNQPEDLGKFFTPSLRNIAKTGPYMHDGVFATLRDVIDFYRHGGATTGYGGTKDLRIVPLDITDDDARDLEAFLGTLTGNDIDGTLRNDMHPTCASGVACCGRCTDTTRDPLNCGGCGTLCGAGMVCSNSKCVAPSCPPGLDMCGVACVDLQTDINNCGSCGHGCATYCTGGMCGGL